MVKLVYRVSHVLVDLGWVDLDLGSSPGWWAATVASYCQSRVVEHPKSKSTKPSPRGHGTPCTEAAPTRRLLLFFASRIRRKLIKTLPLCSGISWQFFCPRGEGGMATASRRHRMSRSPFEWVDNSFHFQSLQIKLDSPFRCLKMNCDCDVNSCLLVFYRVCQ